MGALHFQTSAKEDDGVEEMFLSLTKKMLETEFKQQQQRLKSELLNRRNSQRKNVVVVDDEDAPPIPQSQCCMRS